MTADDINHERELRSRVEEFLYREADLLDEWKLTEWLALLTDDVTYEVPATDQPAGGPDTALFLIADDLHRLRARATSLLGKTAWAERPRSRTRRLITNVRIVGHGGTDIDVTANFAVYRFRNEVSDVYVGRYQLVLRRDGDSFRIRRRRAVLDLEALRPQGKLSIIL